MGSLASADPSPLPRECAVSCAPGPSCLREVREWAAAHGNGFLPRYLGLKRLTVKLSLLLSLCAPPVQRYAVVDVGAGIHGLLPPWDMTATALHDDDSDALWLLAGFNGEAEVHAFEANRQKALHLANAAASRPYTANLTQLLTVHTFGVGANVTTSHVAKCGPPNTWSVSGLSGLGSSKRCDTGASVNVTTLDELASTLSLPIFYVKVDVEGAEWDVLRGMRGLLRRGAVQLVSFEYAVNWHPAFRESRALTPTEAAAAHTRSLNRFQRKLSRYGYDTYLVNSGDGSGVVLVPVHGDFWQDDLEICFNRSRYYNGWGQWCWKDLLVVRRCNACVRRALFRDVLRATRVKTGRWTSQTSRSFFSHDIAPARQRRNVAPAQPMAYASQLRSAFPSCDCL